MDRRFGFKAKKMENFFSFELGLLKIKRSCIESRVGIMKAYGIEYKVFR